MYISIDKNNHISEHNSINNIKGLYIDTCNINYGSSNIRSNRIISIAICLAYGNKSKEIDKNYAHIGYIWVDELNGNANVRPNDKYEDTFNPNFLKKLAILIYKADSKIRSLYYGNKVVDIYKEHRIDNLKKLLCISQ